MRRADRLLQIVRTIYRDILDLQASMVPIEGEAGIGYVLRPGYDLPPLMFTIEEVEAIVLGARLAGGRGDAGLARAADNVLAKIGAVLPPKQAAALEQAALYAPMGRQDTTPDAQLELLRQLIRERIKLSFAYVDLNGRPTRRSVWPLALLYFSDATLLGSWCELRSDYRYFRTDRIVDPQGLDDRFNTRNGAMLDGLLVSECTARIPLSTIGDGTARAAR